ncbi:histidinol-phosphatase HisJ [Alicyclobacillus sp. ALC3]|nr:histidinol-phosphatase HisJ [Alicyclobacillus sp. ALC3]
MKWDGHTHTSFCRHGDSAGLEKYVEQAIFHGFEQYSVTEHPPLPKGWLNQDEQMQALAMRDGDLDDYLDTVARLRQSYSGRLTIIPGLELDYLPGSEGFTGKLVEHCRFAIQEAVVSVHFLPGVGGMRCIDWSPKDFQEGLIAHYGTMDGVVDAYFDEVETAIQYAASLPLRTRIGHLNLIYKFRRALPEVSESHMDERLQALLPLLKQSGVGVDANTAGLRVSTCGVPYVPSWFIRTAARDGIPVVFGSDAHQPSHVGASWDWFLSVVESR